MQHIWAPWRIKYIELPRTEGCILCDKPKENRDAENYILYRGTSNYIILNSFPYNPGHLMVVPYRHLSTPEALTDVELLEHSQVINRALAVLKETFNPAGFNLGMNLGKIAGAGIEGHIHTHIVPRWAGDSNFMTIVSDIRVVPEALADTYRKLAGKFERSRPAG